MTATIKTKQTNTVPPPVPLLGAFIERVVATPLEELWYPSLAELMRNGVATVTHEWDDARALLAVRGRGLVLRALGSRELAEPDLDELVQCEVSRRIHWLNAAGCTYYDADDPTGDLDNACYAEADSASRADAELCWRALQLSR